MRLSPSALGSHCGVPVALSLPSKVYTMGGLTYLAETVIANSKQLLDIMKLV